MRAAFTYFLLYFSLSHNPSGQPKNREYALNTSSFPPPTPTLGEKKRTSKFLISAVDWKLQAPEQMLFLF